MRKCPYCVIPLTYNENRGSSTYDWYCDQCDKYFKLSPRNIWSGKPETMDHISGNSYRYRQDSSRVAHYDKPPCCYIKFHKPQIVIDREFHELYERMKKELKDEKPLFTV